MDEKKNCCVFNSKLSLKITKIYFLSTKQWIASAFMNKQLEKMSKKMQSLYDRL
jgi:hypothetical protein